MSGGKFNNINDVLNNSDIDIDDIDDDVDDKPVPLEEREYYIKAQEMRQKFLELKDSDPKDFKREVLKMVIQNGLEFEAIALAEYTDAPRASELKHISEMRNTISSAIKELEVIDNNVDKMDIEKAKILLKKKELEIREQKLIADGSNDDPNSTVIKDSNVLFVGDTSQLQDALSKMNIDENNVKSMPLSGM